ncbi:hypothetical protein B0H63DRAFT_554795 [Podospora didyma]|uniref:Uncharacterized protein n=1 Tax=Podospora didyma TaxID=330526 RepID=A0AAE0P519_9PEZI|nr:hypothetical protein B0H63DRAFT_554795 [Podospora didyma]
METTDERKRLYDSVLTAGRTESAKLREVTRGRISHSVSVAVFIFYWQVAALGGGFEDSINSLRHLFSEVYGYAVEVFAISSSGLLRKMLDWAIEHGNSDWNPLIVYYLGHGSTDDPHWASVVNWSILEGLLMGFPADKLFLLDCPNMPASRSVGRHRRAQGATQSICAWYPPPPNAAIPAPEVVETTTNGIGLSLGQPSAVHFAYIGQKVQHPIRLLPAAPRAYLTQEKIEEVEKQPACRGGFVFTGPFQDGDEELIREAMRNLVKAIGPRCKVTIGDDRSQDEDASAEHEPNSS